MPICELCKNSVPKLIESHLIPRAAYSKVSPNNGDIIRMSGMDAAYNKKQFQAHLLCKDCEEKFSEFGEKHMGKIWNNEIDFPLLSKLRLCPKIFPECVDGAHLPQSIYDALIYFICSILWRSNCWPNNDTGDYRGALGKKYEAEFRSFLLGKQPQPKIKLMVDVNTNPNRDTNNWFYLPYLRKNGTLRIHSFFILGLDFNVLVGQLDQSVNNAFHHVKSDMILFLVDTFNSKKQTRIAERVQFDVQKRGRLALKYPNREDR